MPYPYHLFINRTEENLADLTTYKKRNSDLTQTIRNDASSSIDFLHNVQPVNHKTSKFVFVESPQNLNTLPNTQSEILEFFCLYKIYISLLSLLLTKALKYSTLGLPKINIPFLPLLSPKLP